MIAVVGQSVIDRIKLPGRPRMERLGGTPIFAARALAAAGRSAVILTRGATPQLRRPLLTLGFRVGEGSSAASCVSEMVLRADGTRSEGFADFGTPFMPSDVNGWMADALEDVRAIVCGAQWEEDFAPETLAALAAGGRPVYLDGQGPLRVRRRGSLALDGRLGQDLMQHLAVLKLAEDEAGAAFGGLDVEAARRLEVPVVVVTLGHRGAVVITARDVVEVGVRPVLGLADTVGAGDAFLALMAAARTHGAGVIEATRLACAGAADMLRGRLRVESRGDDPASRVHRKWAADSRGARTRRRQR